jgi:lipopolysaccharide/colanic/teichoic acid biosynthesis glycosyltransferase
VIKMTTAAGRASVFVTGTAKPILVVPQGAAKIMAPLSPRGTLGRTSGALLRPWRGIAPGKLRRLLDLVVSLGVLSVAGIPLLLLMIAVRLESRGPALFRQIRVGQGERPFTLLKLRSMKTDPGGPEITATMDARITRIGRILRRTSLDELPQLINVLRGEMTLVGPRPETPALAVAYPLHCRWIFAYRPGLTGPSQVRMRDADVLGPAVSDPIEGYLRLVVPARSRIEARYLACPSFPATLAVLVDTMKHILGMEVRRRA